MSDADPAEALQAIMDNAADPGRTRTFSRDELAVEWGIFNEAE
jgi:hypothetical protein